VSAETPGTGHDALARVLYASDWHSADTYDRDTSIIRGRYEGYAEVILASDWLAAYVARQVEDVERERDEAREAVERVTALVEEWEIDGRRVGYDGHEQHENDLLAATVVPALTTALAPTTEPEGVGTGAGGGAPRQDTGSAWDNRSEGCPEDPAQAHPLTLDEHLAEVERQLDTPAWLAPIDHASPAQIVHAYREEMRRG
jgi:hypothetical protein